MSAATATAKVAAVAMAAATARQGNDREGEVAYS